MTDEQKEIERLKEQIKLLARLVIGLAFDSASRGGLDISYTDPSLLAEIEDMARGG